MAQVILAFLALILLHTTASVLARQGLMFSTGIHSTLPAMPVEDGANHYSSQAKLHQESVGLTSEQTSPHQAQSLRMEESPSSAQKRKDEAEEIVNLLHKDYFHKPSGKPPIHNRFTRH